MEADEVIEDLEGHITTPQHGDADGPHPDPLPGGEEVPGDLQGGEGGRGVLPRGERGAEGTSGRGREGENESERDSSLITHHSSLSQNPELSTQNSAQAPELDQLRVELDEARARGLQAYRRALLAENAGRVVPELVAGSTEEEMDASIEIARKAFETARAAALAEVAAAPVPAGNPVRQGPSLEGMSPIEKIAYGLKRE